MPLRERITGIGEGVKARFKKEIDGVSSFREEEVWLDTGCKTDSNRVVGPKPDSARHLDESKVRKQRRNALHRWQAFPASLVFVQVQLMGVLSAWCWLTRTLACLCASASTASEC